MLEAVVPMDADSAQRTQLVEVKGSKDWYYVPASMSAQSKCGIMLSMFLSSVIQVEISAGILDMALLQDWKWTVEHEVFPLSTGVDQSKMVCALSLRRGGYSSVSVRVHVNMGDKWYRLARQPSADTAFNSSTTPRRLRPTTTHVPFPDI